VYPVLPPTAPFTNDSTVLRAALEHHVSARGRTALYDAITTGVDYLSRGTRERKVLVVLSDGGDNASHGYTSTNTAHDGAFRRVRVVVRAPPGRRLLVRSRAGYLAGTTKVEP